MNEYIRGRVRAAAAHTVALAANEGAIAHPGLRGRFREILVDNLLSPWLPPYASCGTGMIVDASDRRRQATQEDIVIFDRSLVPPVLASSHGLEGVFPLNGVLARVEVKSTLTRATLRDAIVAAAEVKAMSFAIESDKSWPSSVSFVFAFDSDLQQSGDADAEFRRLVNVTRELQPSLPSACSDVPSPVTGLCVAGRGCWIYGATPVLEQRQWWRAKPASAHEDLVFFVGALSNTCFGIHLRRQGRDPALALDGGIGLFIVSHDTYEAVPADVCVSGASGSASGV